MPTLTINGRPAKVLRTQTQHRGLSEVFVCPPGEARPHARHMLPTAWLEDTADRRTLVTGGNSYSKGD
jgi:hypothetical protein